MGKSNRVDHRSMVVGLERAASGYAAKNLAGIMLTSERGCLPKYVQQGDESERQGCAAALLKAATPQASASRSAGHDRQRTLLRTSASRKACERLGLEQIGTKLHRGSLAIEICCCAGLETRSLSRRSIASPRRTSRNSTLYIVDPADELL